MELKKVLLGALLSAFAIGAGAEGWYLGASVGSMDADIGGVDNATNGGVLLGYDVLTMDIFATSIEAEFTTTVSDGDFKASGNQGNWDIDTQAAYLAFRLGETVYGKVRFGMARSDISASIAGATFKGSDTSISWGAAAGWMFGEQWGIQADSTLVDSDIVYWNLGIRYLF